MTTTAAAAVAVATACSCRSNCCSICSATRASSVTAAAAAATAQAAPTNPTHPSNTMALTAQGAAATAAAAAAPLDVRQLPTPENCDNDSGLQLLDESFKKLLSHVKARNNRNFQTCHSPWSRADAVAVSHLMRCQRSHAPNTRGLASELEQSEIAAESRCVGCPSIHRLPFYSLMSTSFWSGACNSAFQRPPQALIDDSFASCSVVVSVCCLCCCPPPDAPVVADA